jgi:diguanylate cyclase (GGDEF)-like protein/PAS domain S-box-containing protein
MKKVKQGELALLAAISDVINCMVLVLGRDGRIICSNRACEQIAGMSSDETQERFFWDIFCQQDEVALYRAFFDNIMPEKFPLKVETHYIHPDGSNRELIWEYNMLYKNDQHASPYVLTGYDATEQNKTITALQQTKELYRALVHASPVAVISLNNDLRIESWSSAAESLLGWSEKETLGKDAALYFDQTDHKFMPYAVSAIKGESFYSLEHPCFCKDGTLIYTELSIAPLRNSGGRVFGLVLVASDITERKQYEERLEHLSRHDQLTGLYNRAHFELELSRLGGISVYPLTIITADLDGLKLINDTLGHEHGDKMLSDCAALIRETLRKSDILARVGGDEFAVILPGTDENVGSVVAERIKAKINSYNLKNDSLPLSISLGMATADDARLSLAELYREADDMMYIDKLHTGAGAKSQIIKSLMATLAERDFITAGHALRMEEMCRQLGLKINLRQKQLGRLALLAQVHDIGKVGIPDQILLKNGPLNEEEWKIMRKHSEKGHRIASASADLPGIADLILKHHERWDGSGYPLGLRGKEIPVECRILAIVDAFDAMTSDRPYKQPRSIEDAVEELKNCAGSQFDPELVVLFLSVLAETTIPKE